MQICRKGSEISEDVMSLYIKICITVDFYISLTRRSVRNRIMFGVTPLTLAAALERGGSADVSGR